MLCRLRPARLRPSLACGRLQGALRADTLRSFSARPLLQPPKAEDEIISLQEGCGLDLDAPGVHTLSVIGPSRRGKSVLAGLLAGGDPRLFPQSHSSFQAMTSGTHIVEVNNPMAKGTPLRIIDTEGLSHVGRSRSRREALVRQFLVSTYLTSSWVIWLDSEVLSTSFFTMMWLVHDYVVDVLKVKHEGGALPRLMYIRTQETDVQKREYVDQFQNFGAFFEESLKTHEDAEILRQMFAPGCLRGHSLPVWTVEDLEHFEAQTFWSDRHASPFKEAMTELRDTVLPLCQDPAGEELVSPPLLSMAELSTHLPRIAALEAFDPRDHEAAKVSRLRGLLRAKYGKVVERAGGDNIQRRTDLVNVFDPEDREVRRHGGDINAVVMSRLEEQCRVMRLDPDIARQDPEVEDVLEKFRAAAQHFSAAVDAFQTEEFSERGILMRSVTAWGLEADAAKAALYGAMAEAEAKFQAATGFSRQEMLRLNMHERLKWRIEDCVMRLRAKVAANMLLPRGAGMEPEHATSLVWRLGEWRGAEPGNGKTAVKPKEYAVWTDGTEWALYQDRFDGKDSTWKGVLVEQGAVSAGSEVLPPGPPSAPGGAALSSGDTGSEASAGMHFV